MGEGPRDPGLLDTHSLAEADGQPGPVRLGQHGVEPTLLHSLTRASWFCCRLFPALRVLLTAAIGPS